MVLTYSHSQDVQTILSRHYEAVGAKTKWNEIQSAIFVYTDSSLTDLIDTETFGNTFESRITLKVNKRTNDQIFERFISYRPDDPTNIFSTCYNGKDYWRQKNGGPIESFADYSTRYGCFVQIGQTLLLSRADSIKSLGYQELVKVNETVGCFVLELYIDETSTYFFINSNTGLIEASRHLSLSDKNPITYYSDYRLVNGLLFPFKEVIIKNGTLIGQAKYKSIRLNVDVPDLIFESQTALLTILNSIHH
jgi:hypothetical protein